MSTDHRSPSAGIPQTDPDARVRSFLATPVTLGARTYLTVLPVALAAAAFAVPGASSGVMLAWLGAGVVAEAAVASMFAAGWWMARRASGGPTPGWRLFVAGVVLSAYAVRGLVLVAITQSLDAPDTTSPILRIVASMANMSLWTLLAGALWQARDRYHEELREAGRRLAEVRAHHSGSVSAASPSLPHACDVRSLQESLTGILDRYGQGDIDRWAADLQEAIDHDLRPLSHRLAAAGRQRMPGRDRLRQILWRAIRQPIPLIPVAAILMVVTTTNALLRYPLGDAIVVVALYLPMLLGSIVGVALLRRVGMTTRASNAVLVVAVAGIVPLILGTSAEALLPRPPDPLGATAVALASLAAVAVAGIVQAARSIAVENLRQIQGEIDAVDLLVEGDWLVAGQTGADAAAFLHDVVQSRLTAVRLDASAEPGRLDAATVAQARQLVATDLVWGRTPTHDAIGELEQAVRSWGGVLMVHLDISDGLDRDDPRLPRLCSFAQEMLTNAARHGEATEVDVTLLTRDGVLKCRVRDNGRWHPSSTPGLGLAASRDLAITVEASDTGTVITGSTSEIWG